MKRAILDSSQIGSNQMLLSFFENLQNREGKPFYVTINDNRSTMLSVKWERHQTKVSLHRMFLQAPQNVMDALACYIQRQHKIVHPTIKAFIQSNLFYFNYSYQVDECALVTSGRFFDLKSIYDALNEKYFNNQLSLRITWFGQKTSIRKSRSRLTLGLYYDSLKLIKIHQLLDNPTVPDYVIEYVVYHEMVHAVCPAYVDERGFNRVHGQEFKRKEKEFAKFHQALYWIKQHQKNFFIK